MKFLSILVSIVCTLSFGWTEIAKADIPTGYYKRVDGLKKADLKSAVKASIWDGKKKLSYNSLWTYYQITDVVPGTTNQVFDYYSEMVYYYPSPSCANKEHVCPQSWWGGGASSDSYSDLFNVLPSESKANSAKANFPVGEVGTKVTFSNQRMKVGTSAGNGYSSTVFEPCDEYKGDFARIYFYVATCYDQSAWGSNSNVASTCAMVKEAYPTIRKEFIPMLLKWHREDPVSEWEIGRNDRVYGQQNNRNPYIDYPQLVEYIWGDSTDYAFDLQNARINGYGEYTGGGGNTGGGNTGGGGDTIPPIVEGAIIFAEDFDSIEAGNNYNTSGSSTLWKGNDNFPESGLATVYQAGGAVKLGSGSKKGSLTSRAISFDGGSIAVSVDVKGWTTVEGPLLVSVNGANTQTLTYTSVMGGNFETVQAVFRDLPTRFTLTVATQEKRCFVDNVKVSKIEDTYIEDLNTDESMCPIVDLMGRPCEPSHEGLQIRSGKLVFIRH